MLKTVQKEVLDTMEKGPIYRSLFCNGACFINHFAKGFSGAKLSLSFIAGSMFEKDHQHGLAHFAEHLLFKETKTKNIKMLESLGATLNAYTYKETVCFEMEFHKENLFQLLPVFLDQFCQLDYSQEQFKKEKQVILHELKEDEDDHEVQGVEEVFQRNFPTSLGHPVGGTSKQVKKFTSEDVDQYIKKFFKAQRLVLTLVSGESDSLKLNQLVQDKLEEYFPAAKNKNKKPFRLIGTKKTKDLQHFKKTKKRQMESAISLFSFNGPKMNDKNYYSYLVLDEVLFEGMSSLFFKKLREDQPLVYGMGSSINSFHDCGLYMMIFSGRPESAKELKTAVLSVIEVLTKEAICSELVSSLKKKMKEHWEIGFDNLDERIEFLSDQEVYGLSVKTIKEMRTELDCVSVQSIQKLVHTIYKENEYSYLRYKKGDK